ncbi:(2Fe-2S)-binding protein [Nesterenkonia ebinurensis]|uniref:(2Fe-2S)-binding protein n=1 Tax=Nesterenkonia ebinurensis TaxID=2608252 RepID=UPI00123E1B91|nr:(2Fe-2S)-binding protein [Nesterenkonia ebinurensis]
MSETITLSVDGEEITIEPKRTVAAALMLAAERPAWRRTRFNNEPRGLFCGIGVCFDCLVTVNGEASLRACLIPAEDGMVIETSERGTR